MAKKLGDWQKKITPKTEALFERWGIKVIDHRVCIPSKKGFVKILTELEKLMKRR